jgi:hypothetical protein
MEAKGVVFAPAHDVIAPRPVRRRQALRATAILEEAEKSS